MNSTNINIFDVGHLIGKKVKLVSKSEIRYEGILCSHNPQATISIANVKLYLAEDRATAKPVPSITETFELIIFREADIKTVEALTEPAITEPVRAGPSSESVKTTSNGCQESGKQNVVQSQGPGPAPISISSSSSEESEPDKVAATLADRPVVLSDSISDPDPDPSRPCSFCCPVKAYLENLPTNLNQFKIINFFHEFSVNVTHLRFGDEYSKYGIGIIEFQTEEDLERAISLKGSKFENCRRNMELGDMKVTKECPSILLESNY